jgi:sugar phosphate isomerase/epimerase
MRLAIQLNGKSVDDLVRRLAQAREAGFSLCQINLLYGGVTRADLVKLADAIEDRGVRPVAIGCYINPLRPDEPSPAGVTRSDLEVVLQSLDILGARRVVFWSGTHADGFGETHPDDAKPESLGALRAFVVDVVRSTGARNYLLVLEPWSIHVLSTVERVETFHARLEPSVAEHVRYAVDPATLITPEYHARCDAFAADVCARLGPVAGLARLQDCTFTVDGLVNFGAPGAGALDFAAYVRALMQSCPPDTPAVACNVRSADFAAARDFLLRLSPDWRLV